MDVSPPEEGGGMTNPELLKDKEAAAKKEEMDLAAKKSKRRRDMAMFGREGTFKTSLFGTKDDDVMLAKKNLYGQ